MSGIQAYGSDLAHVHDVGFGDFARRAAPALLALLRQAGICDGRIVDLGCGSGIWARELADAGYQVEGVDISPAMIELARRRVPEATLHVASFVRFPIPRCRAVTALGEVFNYLFDAENSPASLRKTCRRIFEALSPGGLLIFDVAGPATCRGADQVDMEGDDWKCCVRLEHDERNQRLVRRIVTLRRHDGSSTYTRHEETHPLQLFDGETIARMLRNTGFSVRAMPGYGDCPLPDGVAAFVAAKA